MASVTGQANRSNEVREALVRIERALHIRHPIGVANLPDEIRFFRVLTWLRDVLCPQAGNIMRASESRTGELVVLTTDCIVSAIGNIPLPAATIAKHIVGIGFEHFCENPTAVLDSPAD